LSLSKPPPPGTAGFDKLNQRGTGRNPRWLSPHRWLSPSKPADALGA
jgi:hypothetical protein